MPSLFNSRILYFVLVTGIRSITIGFSHCCIKKRNKFVSKSLAYIQEPSAAVVKYLTIVSLNCALLIVSYDSGLPNSGSWRICVGIFPIWPCQRALISNKYSSRAASAFLRANRAARSCLVVLSKSFVLSSRSFLYSFMVEFCADERARRVVDLELDIAAVFIASSISSISLLSSIIVSACFFTLSIAVSFTVIRSWYSSVARAAISSAAESFSIS